MPKKYKIELTEEQMRVLEKCTEMYMRCCLGQPWMLAEEITLNAVTLPDDEEASQKVFDRTLHKRDAIYEMLTAIFRIAFSNGYGTPTEKTEDCMIAECIWDSLRFARGTSRWDSPFQIGSEPCPRIEVMEEKKEGDAD